MEKQNIQKPLSKSKSHQTNSTPQGVANPLKKNENDTLQRLSATLKPFMEFIDNKQIDIAIEKELGKKYPILTLCVKETLLKS